MEERWIINKLGLFNFWYYDDQEFDLSDGKIIFRGTNGSGKSVTTQSFIPLLLDGDTSPERLDPFGSNARKIDNYLLIGKDDEERISYLYMEFVKPKSNTYITIGMGFKARSGKKTETWYFILKDGRRINHDFKFYKYCGEKLPFTAKQLKNALGEGNIFTTDQKEYMEKVNEHLYGYSDMESYSDLLKLLIEVRSPKLSKDFKPTVIYDILKESLSTLCENDLRNIAEAMDNMDSLNVKLMNINKTIKSGKKIAEAFDNYNKSRVLEKGRIYLERRDNVKKLEISIEEMCRENNIKKDILSNKVYDLVALKDDLYKCRIKEKTLRGNKGFALKNEMYELECSENEAASELKRKESLYSEKLNYKNKIQEEYNAEETAIGDMHQDYKKLIKNEEYIRKETYFQRDSDLDNISNIDNEDISYEILNNIDGYDTIVRNNYKILYRCEEAFDELSRMEETRDNKKIDVKVQENKFTESLKYLTNVKSEYIERINMYLEQCTELKFKEEELIEFFKTVNKIEGIEDCAALTVKVDNIGRRLKEEILKKKLIYENRLESIQKSYEANSNSKDDIDLDKGNIDDSSIENYINNYKDNSGIIFDDSIKAEDECALTCDEYIKDNCKSTLKIQDKKDLEKGRIIKLAQKKDNKYTSKVKDIRLYRNNTDSLIEDENKTKDISKSIRLKDNEQGDYKKSLIMDTENLKNEIDILKSRYEILKKECRSFPDTSDIKTSIKLIDESYNLLAKEKTMLTGIEERTLELKKSYDNLKLDVFEAAEYIKIPKDTSEYEKVIKNISEYKRIITECILINFRVKSSRSVLKTLNDVKKNIENDMDNIYKDILNLKDKINKIQIEKKSLNDVLATLDIDKVEKEYKHVTEIINSYPEMIEHKQIEKVRLEEIIKKDNENILKQKEELKKEKELLNLNKEIVLDEINLGYIDKKKIKKSNEVFNDIISKCTFYDYSKRENALISLYDTVSTYGKDLSQYNLKVEDIFTNYIKETDEKNDIRSHAVRVDIKVMLNKKSISIYSLLDYLSEIEQRENDLMGNKEKEIFEDVLVSTLSTKIYAKIHKAASWVKLINEFMEKMDTSNGLKFSLKWVPNRAEKENEMDIYDLTKILSCNYTMNEEEKMLISKHFKEKLRNKKREAQGEQNYRSYISIIKEVLDYREWFEFKLFFKKPCEKLKELTDNEFFKLSGGEKAMAMYVPLFAAVNARYNCAGNKDCPRVVALDEAFAGVDEENIGSMFELIENLNLDYVLNSQVLWGTYASVKSLSIYELIRMGDDVVAPIRYTWNGHIKSMKI